MPRLLAAVAASVLTGCASSGSALDGPVMRYPDSSGSGARMDAEVRGVLRREADCVHIELDEVGERYPVLWPSGTQWDDDAEAVVTPTGEQLSIGDEVSGGGGHLHVEDVDRLAGSDAAEFARARLDNTYGEIAIVDNDDDAIGRP